MRLIRRTSGMDKGEAEAFASVSGIPAALAPLLVQRGIDTPKKIKEYFHPELSMLNDPLGFHAMSEAAALVREMIEAEVPIAVYADYDCDGVCGAAILKGVLTGLGAEVRVYIPDRFTEGYGMNEKAVELLCEDAGLIIAVDCGITSVAETALARDMGAEVIILDHHECGSVLPDTPYIIDPKRPGESYHFKELCGAGIAFKLAQALLGEGAFEYLDIAAVATIGDVVSLTGENRVIAAKGLDKLNSSPCEGLKQLAIAAKSEPGKLGSYHVGFVLAPRLNVAGRMEHAFRALDLLCAKSEQEAKRCAEYLCGLNDRRRTIQKNITQLAEKQAADELAGDRVLVIAGEDFHRGVVGLAASSIAERFHRPAVVLAEKDGVLTGSARSIEGVNIYEALCTARDVFSHFGGHSQAAGMTFAKTDLEYVRKKLNDYAEENVSEEVYIPAATYDLELDTADAGLELAQAIALMEPFGQGNSQPVFLIKNARLTDAMKMGSTQEHSRAKLGGMQVVRFFGELSSDAEYTLTGSLSLNEYRGNIFAQFRVTECEKVGERELSYIRSFPSEFVASVPEDIFTDKRSFFSAFAGEKGKAVLISDTLAGDDALLFVYGCYPEYEGELPASAPDKCIARLLKKSPEDRRVYIAASPAMLKKYPEARLLLDERSLRLLKREAREYFVEEERMGEYLEALKKKTGEYSSLSQLLADAAGELPGANIKSMWFALNVFFEEKLIAFKKGAKICLLYKNADFESVKSPLYASFKNAL